MEFFLSLNLSFHFPPLLSLFFLFPSNHLFIFLSLDTDTKILSVLSVLFLPCSFIRADNIRYVFTRLQVQLFLSYPGIQATSIFATSLPVIHETIRLLHTSSTIICVVFVSQENSIVVMQRIIQKINKERKNHTMLNTVVERFMVHFLNDY